MNTQPTETQAPDQSAKPQLASWVVLREERCRRGRMLILAVNRRDGHAVQLDPAEAALCRRADGSRTVGELQCSSDDAALIDQLWLGGFFTERPAELDQPAPRKGLGGFLATLDVHSVRADRVVRAAYRRGLRHFFHPISVAAQMLLAGAGGVALVAALHRGVPLELHASANHLPLLLVIAAVAVSAHELGHAVALVHFGGSVHSAGFRLHLGTPSFYIESVDALLLTRRQRMIQAAAGPWAEWLVTSIVALTLWRSPIPMLVPVLHRFVLLNSATIASNLLPFVGLDGYWLLADATREPDLAHRSRGIAARAFRSFGRGQGITRDDLVLSTYAVVNVLVAALLLGTAGFFWYQLFGDLLGHVATLGGVGWMLIAALICVLFRPAVLAVRPHLRLVIDATREIAMRLCFQIQRRWRVRATLRFSELPCLADLDELALGIVAGALERVRLTPGKTLQRDGFAGLVLLSVGRGISTWEAHDGLVLRAARRTELFLLPTSSLETARGHAARA